MITQSSLSATIRGGLGAALVPRARIIVPLVVLSFAIFTASAQAHTVTATPTCNSVTFNWMSFASSGGGGGGANRPHWAVVFTPTGGSATTQSGQVSFGGSTYSLTVPISGGNGTLTASSYWASTETRDGHSASWSKTFTLANCPVVVPGPPPPPGTPTGPATLATPALATTASANASLGEAIHDTAVLSGGSSPTGTITFNLYSASDTTCSTVLSTATVPVNGAGSYDSPPVTPADAGAYQWVASYSGDAANNSVSNACNDPNEQSSVAVTVVKASCVSSPVRLRGLSAKVRRTLTVHVTALGVQSVTFYLDGRKLKTVTKPKNQRFTIKVSVSKLGYGRHRLQVRAKARDENCSAAAVAAAFVKVKPPIIRPKFAG